MNEDRQPSLQGGRNDQSASRIKGVYMRVRDQIESILAKNCIDDMDASMHSTRCVCTETTNSILEIIRGVVPEARVIGKHDGHENDARSWCYSCNESAKEEEFTDNWSWNQCRDAMLKELQ